MVTIPAQVTPLPYFGGKQPKIISTSGYLPPGYGHGSGTVTSTINRVYYVPWPIFQTATYSGVRTYNQGTGDNGEKIRIMFFNDDAATGGPGTLAKDFGEITLTGASAVRTLSSSWTASRGMYWGAIWHETAAAMYGMSPFTAATAVGGIFGYTVANAIGSLNSNASGTVNTVAAHYVDTAYGAAPATAVAATASLHVAVNTVTPLVPLIELVG